MKEKGLLIMVGVEILMILTPWLMQIGTYSTFPPTKQVELLEISSQKT